MLTHGHRKRNWAYHHMNKNSNGSRDELGIRKIHRNNSNTYDTYDFDSNRNKETNFPTRTTHSNKNNSYDTYLSK